MEQLNDSTEQPFGYIEIQSTSGALTDEQYQECLKDSAIIKYGQNIYVKCDMKNNGGKYSSSFINGVKKDSKTDFNLRISFNDQSIVVVDETYSSTGFKYISFTTPNNIYNVTFKHNGSTSDIDIIYVNNNNGLKPNTTYTFSFDLNGYNPSSTNGLSLSNIMLNTNDELSTVYFKQINDISFNSTDSLCETYDYYIQVKSDKTYLLTCKANQVYVLQQLDTLLLDEMSAYKTVTVEQTQTASKAYAVGDILIYNNTPYKVTSNIASGGNIIIGTNVVEATTEEIFKYLEEKGEITMEDGTELTKLFLVEA